MDKIKDLNNYIEYVQDGDYSHVCVTQDMTQDTITMTVYELVEHIEAADQRSVSELSADDLQRQVQIVTSNNSNYRGIDRVEII